MLLLIEERTDKCRSTTVGGPALKKLDDWLGIIKIEDREVSQITKDMLLFPEKMTVLRKLAERDPIYSIGLFLPDSTYVAILLFIVALNGFSQNKIGKIGIMIWGCLIAILGLSKLALSSEPATPIEDELLTKLRNSYLEQGRKSAAFVDGRALPAHLKC